MTLDLHVTLTYDMEGPTDILLQVEAAAIPEQRIESAHIQASHCDHFVRVAALDGIGDRIWLRTSGRLSIDYRARMTVLRDLADVATLPQMPLHQLPGETVQYLFDSHYCPATKFHSFVDTEFGTLSGGARIAAMRDWIAEHFTYQSGSSDATTTALDSFVTRHGVCRDYAHVMIVLARACSIPARFASVYAPDVTPQDFHAVAEVFLANPDGEGGAWHLVDPTGMATAADMVKIGVGRDALDVAFLTAFGTVELVEQQVSVKRAA
ncbi:MULTISPECIES: transglutaminase family protein [Pseudomonadota]|jgi:transglutaminase-like putative cysteine protease|uniref:transglutaminase-like domain-containing protein n=2 Tax=Pseudomonadota TaxID=1224 RepID=UPI00076AC336|nr:MULTISPECIES: transglutaminase family protein [Pseudomonadota]MAF60137.1 transglutaminase family protein [Blastomonas sp.]MBA4778550.1 transglutaminase family protein [Blastomonas sp.]|tara:strand:+ start:9894 stop:10691 length:798 start_codon:yes stop_codon:yes gene_type:complete